MDESEDSGTKEPWFTVEPSNVSANVGQKVTFEAQVLARPAPTFRW